MKRILFLILFFAGVIGNAQYTKVLITSGTYPASSASPGISNLPIGFGLHIPPPNPNGKLPMGFIFLHGIGERGPTGDITTPSGVDKVAVTALPYMVRNTNIGRFVYPKGGTTDSLGVAVIFPQCSTSFETWPIGYTAEMIKYIKTNLANQIDTNRLFLCGLSLGGGGTFGGLGISFIRENLAGAFSICPGYYGYNNAAVVADSMPVTYVFHAANDPLANVSIPDGIVLSTNTNFPISSIQYIRFSGATTGFSGHNIWNAVFDSTAGTQAALSNGDTYVHVPLYSIAAGLRKQRYKRP